MQADDDIFSKPSKLIFSDCERTPKTNSHSSKIDAKTDNGYKLKNEFEAVSLNTSQNNAKENKLLIYIKKFKLRRENQATCIVRFYKGSSSHSNN